MTGAVSDSSDTGTYLGSRSAGAAGRRTPLPVISPGIPILVRPGNRVHIGGDPHTALVVELPANVSSRRIVALLASMSQPRTRAEVFADLVETGLTRSDFDAVLDRLVAAGKARVGSPGRTRTAALRIRVHGRGELTHLLVTSLTDAGYAVVRSTRRPAQTAAAPTSTASEPNLVVLADHLVHEPWLVERLMRTRTPHLQIRLREGVGLVGPLVLPGLSSCLDCADRHRADRDPAWPVLAAQLTREIGTAGATIARATAALAHDQIDHLADALAGAGADPPHLVNRVIELHSSPPRIEATTWAPHPLCRCR